MREDVLPVLVINAGAPVQPDATTPATITKPYSVNNSGYVEINCDGGTVDFQTCLRQNGTFVTQESVASGAQTAPQVASGFVRFVVTGGAPTVYMRRTPALYASA